MGWLLNGPVYDGFYKNKARVRVRNVLLCNVLFSRGNVGWEVGAGVTIIYGASPTALTVRSETWGARLYVDGISGLTGSDRGLEADKQLIFEITANS